MKKEWMNCTLKSSIKKAIFIIALIAGVYGMLKHNSNLVVTAIVLFIAGVLVCFLMKNGVKKKIRRGALELSIGTIVIIVIAITMLILGIVFVRNTMCGALGLTGDLNDKVKGEVNRLFGSTGGEVQCIGSSGEAIKIVPGQVNIVYCGIKAPQTAKYSITLTDYSAAHSTKSDIKAWLTTDSWDGSVSPGDDLPKKL